MDFNTSVAAPSPAALDLKPVQSQSPLETLAQMQEIRARSQQMQTQQLQQQELQMNVAQRKAINEAYLSAYEQQPDGTMKLNPDKLTQGLAANGHGEAIPGILEGVTKYQTSITDLGKKKADLAAAERDAAGSLGATVQAGNGDPTLFHTLIQGAIHNGALNAQDYAPLDAQVQQALAQDPSGEAARQLVSKIAGQWIKGSPKQQELENARTSAAAATSRAASAATEAMNNTTRTNAELPGMQAKSAIEQASAEALKSMTPADWQSALETTVPDKTSQLYRRTYGEMRLSLSRGDLKGAQDAINKAGQQLGETERAVATEKALSPLRVQEQVQAEIQKAKLSPDAFAGVFSPQARARAQADYEKSSQEYADKLGSSQQLQDFVRAAQGGNKAAPGLIPIAEVRGLVQRVNRQELDSVSRGAGSVWDRVVGKLNGLTEGQPIPPEVLKDINSIAGTMAQSAKRTYGYKVQVLNGTYGSKAQPIEIGQNGGSGKTAPAVGAVEQGYRFKGGDPSKPESWEKAQ